MGTSNPADVLTKYVPKVTMEKAMRAIGAKLTGMTVVVSQILAASGLPLKDKKKSEPEAAQAVMLADNLAEIVEHVSSVNVQRMHWMEVVIGGCDLDHLGAQQGVAEGLDGASVRLLPKAHDDAGCDRS